MGNHSKKHRYQAIAAAVGLALFLSGLFPGASLAARDEAPLPARVVLQKVYHLIDKKQYQQALGTLLEFQKQDGGASDSSVPDAKGRRHSDVYFALGNCYLLLNQYASAASAYRQALKDRPRNVFAWLNLGKACYELKDFAEAGKCFGKAYEAEEKKQADHLYCSAAAYLMAGQNERAISLFERLLRAHPDQVKQEWQENLVHALLGAGQTRKALPFIRDLAARSKGTARIQWQEILLAQYLQLDMAREALAFALELTAEHPMEPRWWKGLAHVQLNMGRHKDALASLTVYSWLTPLSDEENRLLADLNMQVGIPVKAAPIYEEALKRTPDKRLLKNLIAAYRQINRPATALARIEQFGLKDPEILMLKGDLLLSVSSYKEAAEAYQQAAQANTPQAGRAWLMAGYAAWQAQEMEVSRQAFRNASGFPGQKKEALEAMSSLAKVTVQ